ncbi:serine/threonine-protein phosphatase, partial [Achlya hypogyna]
MSKRKRDDDGDGPNDKRHGRDSPASAQDDVDMDPALHFGARVMVFGKYAASVRYVAPDGSRVGVELDRAAGNCDGDGLFLCRPHRGLFVRLGQLQTFSKEDAAACAIQAVWRRRRCLLAVCAPASHATHLQFQTLVLTSTWNVLDNHQEQLNLKRAELTKGATDTLHALAKERTNPPLVRAVSALPEAYAGPSLPSPPTLPAVLALLEAFTLGHVLHASFVLPLLDEATTTLATEPTAQRLQLPSAAHKLTVVGDLHGQLQDLLCIFVANGLPSSTNMYLFNGDFVDRGECGAEVFLTLVCFKLLYPQSVFLNRGNHECRNQNGWMGFEEEILGKYKSDTIKAQATTVLERFQTCFDALPLCAVVLDKIFVVHGGLFSRPRITLAELGAIDRRREPPLHSADPHDKLFEELLWSDPRQIRGRQPSMRGAGVEFGDDVTVEFCAANKVALVIRSHECVPEGYAIQHGGRLITLFSASRYCGTQLNQGAYLTLGADCKPEIQQFMAPSLAHYAKKGPLFAPSEVPAATDASEGAATPESKESLEGDMLRMIAERICDHKPELFLYFTQHDAPTTPGTVSRIVWAEALKSVLALDLPFLLYQAKLADTDAEGRINYSKFLSRYRIENPTVDASGWQESIISTICKKLYRAMGAGSIEQAFRIFDADANGTIEYDEFMATLRQMDTGLSEQQMFELMRTADTNDDGRLDFAEFVQRFEVIFTDIRSQ